MGKTVTQPSKPPRDAVHHDEHHHQSRGQVLHLWKDLVRRHTVFLGSMVKHLKRCLIVIFDVWHMQ